MVNDMNDSSVQIINSIVAGNGVATNPDIQISQSMSVVDPWVELSYSLVGNLGDAIITEGVPGSNLFGVDPLLGPLQDNGGPALTQALLPGSPALDRGDPDAAYDLQGRARWDQRGAGFDRVRNGRIDLGAFESQTGTVSARRAWLRSLGDTNDDGTPEIGVVQRDSYDAAWITVKDAANGALIWDFRSGRSRVVDVEVAPDLGDGLGLVLLGDYSDADSYYTVANKVAMLTGDWLGSVTFDARFRPLDLAVLPDRDGNDAPELALLTANPTQVELRDGVSGGTVTTLVFPEQFEPRQVLALPDLNGNGSAEVGVVLSKPDDIDRVVI